MGILSSIFKKKDLNIPNYEEIIKTLKLDDSRIIEARLLNDRYTKNIARYYSVADRTGVPMDLIFAIHYRESECSFEACLQNGERIIGTGKKTKEVPANRGPFKTWEESAIDALLMKRNLFPKSWSLASKLEFAEKYNGLGYRYTNEFSPYVFAGTNFHDETGKYVSDGKYNPAAPEKQLGVAAILLAIG